MRSKHAFQLTSRSFSPSTGQWHLTPTQPAPTTPPPRPPAPSTPPTTTPGTISMLQPRPSHWTVVSGRPTNPQEGRHHQAGMWPLWAGPHRDTGSRVEETQRLTGPDSSQLRSTELGTGRFLNSSPCFLKHISKKIPPRVSGTRTEHRQFSSQPRSRKAFGAKCNMESSNSTEPPELCRFPLFLFSQANVEVKPDV